MFSQSIRVSVGSQLDSTKGSTRLLESYLVFLESEGERKENLVEATTHARVGTLNPKPRNPPKLQNP